MYKLLPSITNKYTNIYFHLQIIVKIINPAYERIR